MRKRFLESWSTMDEQTNRRVGTLIASLADGDCKALDEIYRIMGKVMLSIAMGFLKNKYDAEDAVHDALIMVVRKASQFRENKNAYAWINTILKNIIRNRLHRETLRKLEPLESLNGMDAEQEDDNFIIGEVFSRLMPAEVDILIYVYWYGCSRAEVSAILKKPRSTIAWRLQRIKTKLQNFYKTE